MSKSSLQAPFIGHIWSQFDKLIRSCSPVVQLWDRIGPSDSLDGITAVLQRCVIDAVIELAIDRMLPMPAKIENRFTGYLKTGVYKSKNNISNSKSK